MPQISALGVLRDWPLPDTPLRTLETLASGSIRSLTDGALTLAWAATIVIVTLEVIDGSAVACAVIVTVPPLGIAVGAV